MVGGSIRDTISAKSVKPELGKASTCRVMWMRLSADHLRCVCWGEGGGVQRELGLGTICCQRGPADGGGRKLTSARRLSFRSADRRSVSIFSMMSPRLQPLKTVDPYW